MASGGRPSALLNARGIPYNESNDSATGGTDMSIAGTPKPPYYAAIFTSTRTDGDNGYGAAADRMVELAREQEGFLGFESARDADLGITVSYWASLEAIAAWRAHAEHRVAQERGIAEWYASYALRVCKVERDRLFEQKRGMPHEPIAGETDEDKGSAQRETESGGASGRVASQARHAGTDE